MSIILIRRGFAAEGSGTMTVKQNNVALNN